MNIYEIIYYALSNISVMVFTLLFSIPRFSYKKSVFIYIAGAVVMTFSDLLLLCNYNNSHEFFVAASVIRIIIMQAVNLFVSKERDSKTVFTGFFGISMIATGNTIGTILYIIFKESLILILFNIIISLTLIILFTFKLRKHYLNLIQRNIRGWGSLCLIPVLFYLCFYFLTYYPRSLFYVHENIPAAVTLLVTMIVFYFVMFKYMENEKIRDEIYWENKMFQYYIKGFETQYDNVEKSEKELKILRHDLRHFSQMIESLLKQKEYDKIRQVLDNISETAQTTVINKYCENIMINSIIGNYAAKAEPLGICFHIDVIIPQNVPVNNVELASVFANLIENAFLSVKKVSIEEKNINIFSRFDNKRLIIEIKNNYEEEIIFDSYTNFPISNKGKGHGIGIQSIAAFVEKTDSLFDCSYENNIFIIRILADF